MAEHLKYASAPRRAYTGELSDLADSNTEVRAALMASSFSVDRSTQEVWADVSGDEIDPTAQTGYSSGGQALTGKTVAQSGTVTTFDADDVVWPDSTIEAYYAVVYDATPSNDVEKELLTVLDFDGQKSTEEGDFRLQWGSDGIFEVEVL